MHEFRVPLVAEPGVVVDSWQVMDARGNLQPDAADLAIDSERGGVMFSTRAVGDFYVLARAGNRTGCAELHVRATGDEQWLRGQELYHTRRALAVDMPDMPEQVPAPENVACSDCHGEGAQYLAIEYTPAQTSGYSDSQLGAMMTQGIRPVPPDPSVPSACTPFAWTPRSSVPEALYRLFHRWEADDAERSDLVTYLRSRVPVGPGPYEMPRVPPDSAPPPIP